MTITPAIRIVDRKLVVKDQTILTDVPENIVSTPAAAAGIFLGAVLDNDSSRHVIPLGTLREVRFLACFRFMLWWMAQKMGDKGRDIPLETQFLLLETLDKSAIDTDHENKVVYTVFLPLVEGPFKACLQGTAGDELELCIESGDANATASAFTHSIYITSGADPFRTIHEAIMAVKQKLGTFKMRHEKKLPGIVDYFGWCTWDAFYQEVTQEGVEAGLRSLTAGGAPPKFVIIDDGWQSTEPDRPTESAAAPPKLHRLTSIKENYKFQNADRTEGIKNIVKIAKEKYGLKYVYVWHAITGYWGGVRPAVKEMEHYESALQDAKVCKGVIENEPGWKTNELVVFEGYGLVNPKTVHRFYNDLHGYLASSGIDGVKVDGQCILETVGDGHGGRVELTKQYHQALDASIARHFPDNGCIACMSHNLESIYCSKQTAIVRASDDFYPRNPLSPTILIAAVAYNSFFLGEIMQPDWDMFHSLHPAAEYHASARAISGGPVYVSDAPGNHNFDVLKKLVLPDGSVLRARLPGRPTKDCLFSNPALDGVSLLKIWNMNKYTGVVGVYNCQGAAWNSVERKNTSHHTNSEAITGYVRGSDVHLISEAAVDPTWDGHMAVYVYSTGLLTTQHYNVAMPVSLKILEHEIFTLTPIKVVRSGVGFAPLGLIDMFNGGGAIEGLRYENVGVVSLEVKGCGRFGAYSSSRPKKITVGSLSLVELEFEYEAASGLVTFNLVDMPPEHEKFHNVVIEL